MRRQCVSMPGHMGTAHSGPLKLLLPATLFSVHTLYLVGFSFSGTVNLGRSGSCWGYQILLSSQASTFPWSSIGSWPPFLINRNWSEARKEIQAMLYWGPCCSRGEQKQIIHSLVCLLPKVGSAPYFCSWPSTFAPGSSKVAVRDFSGGSVVENEPANAGDTGWISDTGRSHMLQGNKVPAPQLFSLCYRALELQLLDWRAETTEAWML